MKETLLSLQRCQVIDEVLKRTDDEREANFDDADQTDDVRDKTLRLAAREGAKPSGCARA